MMQQVATTKSELAAFAIGAEASGQQDSAVKEQFGLLLKDQQNSLNKNDKAVNSVKDVATKDPVSDNEQAIEVVSSKHAKEKYDSDKVKDTATLDGKSAKSQPEVEGHDDVKVTSPHKGEHDVLPRDLDIDMSKSEKTADFISESEVVTDLETIDVQQWVNLVDNLQGLNKNKRDLQPDTQDQIVKESEGELALSDLEHNLETLNFSTSAYADTIQAPLSQQLAEKIIGQLDNAPNKAEFNKIVSKILETLSDDTPAGAPLVHSDNIEANLGFFSGEKHEALIGIELPDLTKDVNKSLLLDLLQENELVDLDKSLISAEVDNTELLTSNSEQVVFSELADQVMDVEYTEEEVTHNELGQIVTADSLDKELVEHAIEPEVLTIANSIISPKESKHFEVKALLDLPDTKLNKVLENISSRVIEPEKVSGATLTEQNQLAAQRTVTTLIADLAPASELASKEFVAALKTGLQEFKSQLAQGREPGLDLKALIAEAATKVSDQSLVNKSALSSEQTSNSVSQVIDFASSLSQAIEHNQNQSYNNHARDVAQIQGEQSKQIQLSQLETKFEKAINITKPEGHQQLAEKVRWMVNTKNLVADIRLDPAELGSVHVKVAMSGDSATVNFVVQSHHARDAMDSATPRLRDMLAEKGIELGQSSVRQESNGKQQEQGEFAGNSGGTEHGMDEVEVPDTMLSQQNVVNGSLGGIDYFV
ncbi:flagellar hook-length control protein FliK [Paraglaciecola sp.]|uniref:flagellar hook-length control protein FliK n=1 Tax=Paraglaciecola sp. TaxID=1920173 RepID=UPI003266B670